MQEVNKFYVKINFIPNANRIIHGLNLRKVFIDSMQFMNFCLDPLVKNLADNNFTYLSQEFTDE